MSVLGRQAPMLLNSANGYNRPTADDHEQEIRRRTLVSLNNQNVKLMTNPLTPDSFMEYPIHGRAKPAFICQHLQHGTGLGFFTPAEPATPDDPWEQAWCGKCEEN